MFKLKNPLPDVLRDTDKLRNFYKDLNLVPYAGTTSYSGHSFLKLLIDFYDLSPSHGTCIDDIAFWAFEGQFDLVKKTRPGLMVNREDLPEATKVAFYDYLDNLGIKLIEFVQLFKQLYKDWKKTGDAYLHIVDVTVAGERQVSLNRIDPTNWMYLNTEDGEPRSGAVSKDFLNGSITDNPKILRVYPNWMESANKRETVYHIRNVRGPGTWYGRPDSLHALFWMFVEWQQANYSGKVATTELTMKLLLFLEKPDPNATGPDGEPIESGIKTVKASLKKVASNSGAFDEADSIGVIEYPHGGQTPTAESVEIHRDKDWMESQLTKASDFIYSAHRWSKILTGYERPRSGIGGNVLLDEFLAKNTSTIRPTQDTWENIMFGVLNLIVDQDQFSEIGIKLGDKVSELVEDLRTESGTPTSSDLITDPDEEASDDTQQ